MGRGRIVSGGESGLYQVEILHDRRRLEAEIDWLQTRIDEIAEDLEEAEAAVSTAQQAVSETSQALSAAIAQFQQDGETDGLMEAQAAHTRASSELSIARSSESVVRARKARLEKRLQSLQSIPDDPVVDAWCADHTEDLEGEVGTMDLPGEGHARAIIRPGFEGAAAYDVERDGQLRHRESCTPEQAYLNAALLPGWQKWKYPYRVGKIQQIEGDQCSVMLDEERSSAQGLVIQVAEQINDVPITYMDCDGAVFEEGDRVVVQFHQTEEPKVIGFEKEPKRCGLPLYVVADFQEGFRKGSQMLLKLSPDLGSVEQTLTIPGTTETAVSYSQTNAPIWSLAVAGARGDTRHAVVFGAQLRFSSGVTSSAHDYQSVSSDGERFIALLIAGSEPFYRYEFYDLDGGFLYGCALQNPPNGFTDNLQLPNSEASPDRMFSIWRTASFYIAPWEYDQCQPVASALVQGDYTGHIAATATRRAAVRYQSGAGVALDLFSTGMTHHSSLTVPGYSPNSTQTVMSPAFRPRSLTVAGHTHHPSFETFENVFIQVDGVVFPQGDDPFEFGDPQVVNLTEAHGFTRVNHATINKTAMRDLGGL